MFELLPENVEIRKALKGFADEVYNGDIDDLSAAETRAISVVFLMGTRYGQEVQQFRRHEVRIPTNKVFVNGELVEVDDCVLTYQEAVDRGLISKEDPR